MAPRKCVDQKERKENEKEKNKNENKNENKNQHKNTKKKEKNTHTHTTHHPPPCLPTASFVSSAIFVKRSRSLLHQPVRLSRLAFLVPS